MERFLERHASRIVGVLSGPDRVLFRGIQRSICYVDGMDKFLSRQRVLYKDFGRFAQGLSEGIKARGEQVAQEAGRPFEYLPSSRISKEERARAIMARDGVRAGLICVLSCVEPCRAFGIRKDRAARRLQLVLQERKCLHLYFYYLDREFGLMHVRLATWLPFDLQVCLNGREYLGRQLDKAGIGYEQQENCLVRIDDFAAAQRILDRWPQRHWCRFLNVWARRVNPWLDRRTAPGLYGYYWTIREDEYATDVVFKDAASLREIYPGLVHHAIAQFTSQDVLRFLGRRTNARFNGQISSNLRQRPEGVRIKHWVEENSIKMYDKQGCVLRIETSMNNPKRFKVRRAATRGGRRGRCWQPLRKSVADLPRRVEIARAANGRYLEALAVVGVPAPTAAVLDPVSRRTTVRGRPYRPLRPISREDAELFRVVMRGEFAVQGFRNREVREQLLPERPADPSQFRKQSARISRLLRLLRAHGLIGKVGGTRYYRVTHKGHQVMSTALKLREADVTSLAA